MKRFVSILLTTFCGICLIVATDRRAWGYVDPGSGLLALQTFRFFDGGLRLLHAAADTRFVRKEGHCGRAGRFQRFKIAQDGMTFAAPRSYLS